VDYSLLDSSARSASASTAPRRCTDLRDQAGDGRAIVPYLLLVLMLVVRPRGLLGTRTHEDRQPARRVRRPSRRGQAGEGLPAVLMVAGILVVLPFDAGPRTRLRALDAEPDGHRRGVRAGRQRAAGTDRLLSFGHACTSGSAATPRSSDEGDHHGPAGSHAVVPLAGAAAGLLFGVLFGSV